MFRLERKTTTERVSIDTFNFIFLKVIIDLSLIAYHNKPSVLIVDFIGLRRSCVASTIDKQIVVSNVDCNKCIKIIYLIVIKRDKIKQLK